MAENMSMTAQPSMRNTLIAVPVITIPTPMSPALPWANPTRVFHYKRVDLE